MTANARTLKQNQDGAATSSASGGATASVQEFGGGTASVSAVTVTDASSLAKALTCGCPQALAAAQALAQAVAQSGCGSTAVVKAFLEAEASGQGQAFLAVLAGTNVRSCLPADAAGIAALVALFGGK